MSLEEKFRNTKAEIRSLVVSSPVGLTVPKLIKEYMERIGKNLPYKEFGYTCVVDFLSSLTDHIQIEHTNRGTVVVPVRNEQVAHIHDLVQKQKKKPFNYFRPLQKPEMTTSRAIDVLPHNSHTPYHEIKEETIKTEQIVRRVDYEKVTMQITTIPEVQKSSEIQIKSIKDADKTKEPLNLSNRSTINDSSSKWIPNEVLETIIELTEKYPQGIKSQDMLNKYEDEFKVKLDIKELGFENIESFLANCVQLKIVDEESVIFPKAKAKKKDILIRDNNVELSNSANAFPPPEQMKHLWKSYFTDEVCDPTCDYKKFQLPKVTQMKVSVSDVHSPSAIWLQPLEYATRLNNLMNTLNLFYDDLEEKYLMQENVIKPGQVCCVRFHLDNRWYRSKILEVKDKDQIKVCYVDYGTINWEKHSSLRLLHKKFIDDPIHVVRAKLHNLQPKNKNEWGNEVSYYLFELLYQKSFFAVIMEHEESIPMISVMLIDTSQADDININDMLIQKEFARCSAILSVDQDDEEVDFQNQEEAYEKDKFLDISNFLAGILQKILPGWLTLGTPMDGEGVGSLFREIEENADGTVTNKQLNLCCSSHFIRSLFLTDAENISRIWHNVILKNIVYIYQEFLKDVTALVPMEERYFRMPPFCEKYSSEIVGSTLHESVLQSASPLNGYKELKINMKTNELTLSEGHQMIDNGDCSETVRSVKSHRKYDYDFYPEFASKKDSCASSTITSRNQPSNRSCVVCPLQYERDGKNFVFEAELDDGRTLILVLLGSRTYVVREHILRDFTTGIPTMLLTHRVNKFTYQAENILITPNTHPQIFRYLKGCGIIKDSQGTLMPLANIGKFLRIVSPQDKYLLAFFDSLTLSWESSDQYRSLNIS